MTIQDFKAKWSGASLNERAASQEHFIDLCRALGMQTPANAKRKVIAAAERLNELRENWLNPEDASEAELKKRTLTNLYNARPTWLDQAHQTLDRAVWSAYGWDEEPSETDDETILRRLLMLNLERANGTNQ